MKEDPSVDFLKKKYNMVPRRSERKRSRQTIKIIGGLFALLAIGGMFFSYRVAQTHIEETADTGHFSFFSTFQRLVTSGEKELTGEDDDRINFLLLGHGGAGHAGPELTDTIIFASFKPSTSEIGFMSIPRDLIVSIPGHGYRKINHVNAYAEQADAGSGPDATADVVSGLLNQEIHYTVKADFDGFEELIDAVGGVDVHVDRSFADYTYPTDDYLVQTVTFTEGWQHMDGETALQYSRSRHGTNGEGSDFARSRRQQKVLLALKDEVLSPSVLLSPGKLNRMIDLFQENVKTDLTFWEMMKLARFAPDIESENVSHYVLDASPGSPLYSSTINGAYVLLPKEDDWSEIQHIAANIFDTEHSETLVSEDRGTAPVETVRVEIQNGTGITGLAFQASQLLSTSGVEVVQVGNAESRAYNKTIIYDLTEGTKSDELAVLKDFLEADVAMSATGWIYADEVVPRELSVTTPGETHLTAEEPIDFLIILGSDAENLVLR